MAEVFQNLAEQRSFGSRDDLGAPGNAMNEPERGLQNRSALRPPSRLCHVPAYG